MGIVYGSLDGSAATGYSSNSAVATTPAFGQIVGLLQNGIPPSVQAAWPTLNNPAAGQGPGAVVPAPILLDPNTGRPARLLAMESHGAAHASAKTSRWKPGMSAIAVFGRQPPHQAWLCLQNALSQSTLASLGVPSSAYSNPTLSTAFNTTISALTAPQKQALAAVGLNAVPPL